MIQDRLYNRIRTLPERFLYSMSISKKKRFEGCLIGGAIGDALGYPVEFISEQAIFSRYGEKGICTLEEAGDPAVISDDTQMTLFAAHALIYDRKHPNVAWDKALRTAYREWYVTQTHDESLLIDGKPQMEIYYDKRLHKNRAPGNTCLTSIRSYIEDPKIKYAENNSKGCGTVMRAAPYGLAVNYNPVYSYGDAGKQAYMLSKVDAMITHGHEDAWKASATLATIIFYIVHYWADTDKRLQEVIGQCLGMWETDSCVRKAITLAEDTTIGDLDAIHQLGEGWVADEALAIAIFCAVRYQDDFAKAIRVSVNHKGDSDSTGAICGNILGAWLGMDEVRKAFDLNHLEMRDLIMKTADELYYAITGEKESSDPEPIVLDVKKILANDRIAFYRTPDRKHLVDIRGDETYKTGVYRLIEGTDQWEEDPELSATFLWDIPRGEHDAFLPKEVGSELSLYAFIRSSKQIFQPQNYRYYVHFNEKGIAIRNEPETYHLNLPRGWKSLSQNYMEPAYGFMLEMIQSSKYKDALKAPTIKYQELSLQDFNSLSLTECLRFLLFYFRGGLQYGQSTFCHFWDEGKTEAVLLRLEKLIREELSGKEDSSDNAPRAEKLKEEAAPYTLAMLEKIANETYTGIQMFARDVDLNPELAKLYKPGMIICEKGFTDATFRFMGMATSHRFVILSNHMANMAGFEHGTNWGLHMAKAGSHFKVLGQSECKGKVGIFLLHLPDGEDWKAWRSAVFSTDEQLYQMAVQRFNAKCNADILPELNTPAWRDRCAAPLGMDESGNLFEF